MRPDKQNDTKQDICILYQLTLYAVFQSSSTQNRRDNNTSHMSIAQVRDASAWRMQDRSYSLGKACLFDLHVCCALSISLMCASGQMLFLGTRLNRCPTSPGWDTPCANGPLCWESTVAPRISQFCSSVSTNFQQLSYTHVHDTMELLIYYPPRNRLSISGESAGKNRKAAQIVAKQTSTTTKDMGISRPPTILCCVVV